MSHDPNTRRHETGAVRSTDVDQLHYTSISPIALRRLAAVHAAGDDRYGRFNWEKGFPIADLLNHVIPHIFNYLEGDRSEDHLGHALWGLAAAIHSEELWPHLNEGTLRGDGCKPPAAREAEEGGDRG